MNIVAFTSIEGYLQVLAAVFGPREVEQRSKAQHGRAIVNCEYAMATFSTGQHLSASDVHYHSGCTAILLCSCNHAQLGHCIASQLICKQDKGYPVCKSKGHFLVPAAQHTASTPCYVAGILCLCSLRLHLMLLSVSAGERRKRGKGDRRATELSTVIRNCLEQTIMLELMAGSQIDVFVQVLQVRHG